MLSAGTGTSGGVDWSNWVLVALTAVSVLIALAALAAARNATGAAGTAVLAAKDANELAKKANTLSEGSNAIAERAAQDARKAPVVVAWDEFVIAVAALQTFDPAGSDGLAGPLLTALRTRATLLVDKVPWKHFDKWLATEQLLGVQLMREASEKGQAETQRLRRPLTPEEALAVDTPFHQWVAAYTTNVRMSRKEGPVGIPFEALIGNAWAAIEATSKRNGWPVPTGQIEGIEPLDLDSD